MPEFNAAFWKWFGASRVVDADGQPLVAYHGTDADARVFSKANMIDAGFYFTDVREYAENYGANVVAAYLRLENPLLLTHEWFDTRYPTPARMQAEGHDGFIVTRAGGASMFVVFSAKQIKAVDNDGTWDADDPDILSNPAKQARERLITSQWYLDPRIVAEKRRERDYEVLVSEPFEYEGETFRLVLDGHHSLRAAIQDAAEPIFLEATGQQDDSRRLLATQGPEAYLASHQDGVDWRDAFTGHPIW